MELSTICVCFSVERIPAELIEELPHSVLDLVGTQQMLAIAPLTGTLNPAYSRTTPTDRHIIHVVSYHGREHPRPAGSASTWLNKRLVSVGPLCYCASVSRQLSRMLVSCSLGTYKPSHLICSQNACGACIAIHLRFIVIEC